MDFRPHDRTDTRRECRGGNFPYLEFGTDRQTQPSVPGHQQHARQIQHDHRQIGAGKSLQNDERTALEAHVWMDVKNVSLRMGWCQMRPRFACHGSKFGKYKSHGEIASGHWKSDAP